MKHLRPRQKEHIIEILGSGEAGCVHVDCEKESYPYALELCEAIRGGGWEIIGIRVNEWTLPMMTTEVGVRDYASPGIKAHRLLSALRAAGATDVHDFARSENTDADCPCLIVGRGNRFSTFRNQVGR